MCSLPLLFTLLICFLSVSANDCGDFQAAACPLDENNIIEFLFSHDAGDCQKKCLQHPQCKWFTSYTSQAMDQCWLLKSCERFDNCQDCVSGPPSPPFSGCPWPPGPTPSGPSTPGTTTGPCGVFHHEETCSLQETNIIDSRHDVAIGECQDICAAQPDCNWFTWYSVSGLSGNCWLLHTCSELEVCEGCTCGPARGVDVDDC